MSSPANYPLITISLETVFGQDENMDKAFEEYLNEYSIVYTLPLNEDKQTEWPVIEYTGGPIALSNMLREKFGYSREEIEQTFPQIMEAL